MIKKRVDKLIRRADKLGDDPETNLCSIIAIVIDVDFRIDGEDLKEKKDLNDR